MRVLFKSELYRFWRKHPDSKGPLAAWLNEVERTQWGMPSQVTDRYPTASGVPGSRMVFRIKGNRYRMVVKIDYQRKEVYILFVGTHAEYNRIDATEV